MSKLQEKASIDWNNYLTPEEVQKFLSKDDKVESAEEIVYNTKGNFYDKYFKDFKEQGWTKRELTQDLANFYHNGHLIEESKEDIISQINEITNKCIEAGLKDKLKEYTIPCMRDYQLKFNPTADNRVTPWLYLVKELKDNKDTISWELQEFADTFIKEANKCYKENNKLQESLLLYHGSPNKNITKLEMGKEKTTGDEFGTGIYLTKQYDEAEQYAGLDGKVYKVELDDNNLYNLNDKLPNEIKEIVKTELVNNNDIKNQIVAHNRKQYKVIDKAEGQKFYNDKKQEWKTLDNTYYANMPKVNKIGEDLIVTYTDYNDIDSAITNLTGDDLQKILSGNIDPNVFVELIIKAGFDGIITHNNNWYIIYRNEDKAKIVENEQLNEGIHLYGLVKDEDGNYKTIEDSDYPDKKSFESDLKANGYTVRRINDNRDNYIMDHSDYLSISNIKSEIAKLKKDYEFYKENGIETLCANIKSKIDNLQKLVDEANKVSLTESHKLEEVSRNELLAKTKMQTKTRYDKADSYRGFSIVDVNTDTILTRDTLEVTCKVGKYWDTIELEDILYWIQYEAEKNKDNQVNVKTIITAILEAVDAMEIKVDCTCGDFKYRMAYQATQGGYKYGKPENRPAKITNPNNYGALCKHLVAMLSNKKWMQQVATPVMDWFEKRIDEANRFLRTKPGTYLTLPNELARRNAKAGAYAKMFDKIDDEENKDNEDNAEENVTQDEQNETNNTETNKEEVNNNEQ